MLPETNTPYNQLVSEFVAEAQSQFSALNGEIAERNGRIQTNDSYIYGDLLKQNLDIPFGHDYTEVNWLRRAVEIHRTQFMGEGFTAVSPYVPLDIGQAQDDPQQLQDMEMQNDKKKAYAEARRKVIHGIFNDNGGDAFWGAAAENASAIGDTVVKTWFDEDAGKYKLQQVEAVEHVYALWSRDDYRDFDAVAYIQQISKQKAIDNYGVPQDVATSPLGFPLAVLSSANIQQYVSTQPMVTLMEITGKLEGWKSTNGILRRCLIGDETEINVTIVGDQIYKLIDEFKKIPRYYIFPNKRERRRPWGRPDITDAAININATFIEALSDWRTLGSKVNFPKWKAFGFAPGVQFPKPKPRTVEMLPLVEGQDLQPLNMPNSAGLGEADFQHQLTLLENQFIRETGISRNLFDMPDAPSNSNQAMLTSMRSVSDLTETKRQLWSPILEKLCTDALRVLAEYDDNIKEIVTGDEDWFMRISWPAMLNKDDPAYHSMMLNQFNAGLLSIASFHEGMGYDKQELDLIREEMEDKVTAAIHGHALPEMAQLKLINPASMAPKVNVNLRGDLTPEDVGNIAYERGLDNGPFAPTIGPQGNEGLRATDAQMNKGLIAGGQPNQPTANQLGANGQPLSAQQIGQGVQASQPNGPAQITTPAQNQPGQQPMSQPGSGAPPVTPTGNLNQHRQRKGG